MSKRLASRTGRTNKLFVILNPHLVYRPEINISASQQLSNTPQYCSCCKQYGNWTRRCGNCLSTYYCSGKCQRNHWRLEHKLMCSHLKKYLIQNRDEEDSDDDNEGDAPPRTPPQPMKLISNVHKLSRTERKRSKVQGHRPNLVLIHQNNTYPQTLKNTSSRLGHYSSTSDKLPTLIQPKSRVILNKGSTERTINPTFEAEMFPRFNLQHAATARRIHDAMQVSKHNKRSCNS